jgi:tripartite-type tricarboxylate transporter receptor subunit TctC
MSTRPQIRIRDLCAGLIAAAIALAAPHSAAQNYPSGPIRIVVPFTPGGGTDILSRMVAVELNKSWGQPVVIDNRPGASGTLGTAVVAKAVGDGQTILVMPAAYASNPSLYKNLTYDQNRDLAPVSLLASGPLVLVVHPSLPVKSIKDLVAFVRARPGEINFGTPGAGTLPHLSAELFNSMNKIKMVQIPYKGAGAAATDVMAGRVQVYFMNILQCLSLVKAGKLRALGVTTPQRSAIAPEIPAIAESGLKGYDMTNWYGMLVPSATPRDVVTKLNVEVNRILKLPDLTARLAQDGMTVAASSPAQFGEFLTRETAKFNRVIEEAGIKGSL